MSAVVAPFSARSRILALWGWFHVALLVLALSMAVFDARWVLGSGPWSKSLRLMISMAMLLWTLARLPVYLRGPRWKVILPRVYLWRIRIGLIVFILRGSRWGLILCLGLTLALLILLAVRKPLLALRGRSP